MRLGGAKSKMNAQRSMHVYEVRPRRDKRGVDLISDVLPFFLQKLRSAISVEQVGMEAPVWLPNT
jgi:hypothetical protein